MAFSVESRLPFLDHRLVEFCFSLQYDEKVGDGWTKLLLRRATQELLPQRVDCVAASLDFLAITRRGSEQAGASIPCGICCWIQQA